MTSEQIGPGSIPGPLEALAFHRTPNGRDFLDLGGKGLLN